MRWIAEQSEVISALASVGTLLVWIVYLQLFVSSYRRQLRAMLLITRGAGNGREARCLLSNMSSGVVYIESVLVEVRGQSRRAGGPVTDIRDAAGKMAEEAGRWTRQGPLGSGETRDLGSFGSLIRQALSHDAAVEESVLRSVTVRVIGLYGTEDLPVGAWRTFALHDAGRVAGEAVRTTQIRGRHARRRLIADLERDR